jgi:hypothetical protein
MYSMSGLGARPPDVARPAGSGQSDHMVNVRWHAVFVCCHRTAPQTPSGRVHGYRPDAVSGGGPNAGQANSQTITMPGLLGCR